MSKSREKIVSVDTFNEIAETLSFEEIHEALGAVTLEHRGVTYYCSLTGVLEETPCVGNIWAQFNKIVGVDNYDLKNKENYGYKRQKINTNKIRIKWDLLDPGGYTHVLSGKSNKWLKCYSYDVNSSYSFAMCQPMPNTAVEPRLNDYVGKNEIGFTFKGGVTTEEGIRADFIFPLMPSPFVKYVNTYYSKKREAKFKEERKKWKFFLNVPTGMMQRFNIFIRLAILYYAREYIKQYIDDNTVYCNVDCIVSLKPRDDLPLGEDLGQFKQEHVNEPFKYLEAGIYQWDSECHYKGIPGCTLTDISNISNWQNNFPYMLKGRKVVKRDAI